MRIKKSAANEPFLFFAAALTIHARGLRPERETVCVRRWGHKFFASDRCPRDHRLMAVNKSADLYLSPQ